MGRTPDLQPPGKVMNSSPIPSLFRSVSFLLVVSLLFVLSAHLYSLSSRPKVVVDEAVSLSRVEALLKTGRAVGEFDDLVYGFEYSREIFNPNLPYYFFAIPTFLGFDPSIGSLRVMSFIAGLMILAAVGVIAARAFGKTGGLCAMLMTSISPGFVLGSHFSRPDVLAAGLGYLSIALYSLDRRRAFGAAFLATLAFSAHQRSIILSFTLGVLILVDVFRKRAGSGVLVAVFLGGVSALLVIFCVDIAPYGSLESFISNQRLVAAAVPPPFVTGRASVIVHTLGEFLALLGSLYPAAWLLVSLFIFRVIRDSSIRRDPLTLIVCVSIFMSLLCVHGMVSVKAVIFSPSVDLLFVSLLFGKWPQAFSRKFAEAIPAVTFSLFFLSVLYVDYLDLKTPDCRDRATEFHERLRHYIPPEANVMGEENFWLYLRENRYLSWKRLHLSLAAPGVGSLEDVFKAYRPDYLLYDVGVAIFVSDVPRVNRFHESLRVSRSDFMGVVDRWAARVGTVDLGCHGAVDIYRFDWTVSKEAPGPKDLNQ